MIPNQRQIEERLILYQDPYLKQDLYATKAIKNLTITDEEIQIEVVLKYPAAGCKELMIAQLKNLIAPLTAGRAIKIHLSFVIDAHAGKHGIAGLTQVKNILAVASGKGGVGKSTLAVNLALALSLEGARVGLLDADIYGPSQPSMLGTASVKQMKKPLKPVLAHGIQSMSMGYLIGDETPMIWRGPMISMAMQQLLHETEWEMLDYLIVDLPPGTGDIPLSLAQKMPLSGALIVTTPQDLALLDVRRAYEMFKKLHIDVMGIVENMSHYHCSQCGFEEAIFGSGGGLKFAEQVQIPLLAKIPLALSIREMTDSGKPTVIFDQADHTAQIFRELARQVAANLSLQPKDYSAKFPKITVKQG